jgi:hypothetical protein
MSAYDASMSANTNGFAAPRARDIEHIRRAKVAPLLAASLSVRAISARKTSTFSARGALPATTCRSASTLPWPDLVQ